MLFLVACGTGKTQTTDANDNSHEKEEIPIAKEAWMDFDKDEEVSYVDLYQYGRLKLPGRWQHSDGEPPRYFGYKNSENHMLRLDRGLLDTMSFYSDGITKAILLTKLYEQGTSIWKEKKTGDLQIIEQNNETIIAMLTIDSADSANKIYLLCGLKDRKTMTLYLVPKRPADLNSTNLLKRIYKDWSK